MSIDIPALNATLADWNAAHPPGTWVKARIEEYGLTATTVRLPATLLGSGKLMVWLQGVDKAVPIDAVRAIEPHQLAVYAPLTVKPPWSDADDRALLAARLRGRSFPQISEALGRPPLACEERYQQIKAGGA